MSYLQCHTYNVIPTFNYPMEIRRLIYTTTAIEMHGKNKLAYYTTP
ncbi:hypothetical protein [Leptothoe sp. PORK10 BA2]|nr:hypothetical protein [Leptothoe sp. PORK10 BA2]MEA5463546.1 hypothetical protein [Leptothoe sp. PORK10 BA2]